MFSKIILSVAVITSVALSGCSFLNEQPYRQVDYFDLGSPAQYSINGVTVKFMKFRGLEAAKYKMVYHEDDTRVLIDDYNKWIQPPGFMLNRFLQNSFSTNQNAASNDTRSYDVSGTLFEFKIDLKKQLVILGVTYIIRDGNSNALPPLVEKSVSYTAPFKERTGYAFSQAMTQAAKKLTESIYKDIKKISSKKK